MNAIVSCVLIAFALPLAGCEAFHAADADREVHAAMAKYQDRVLANRASWVKQPAKLPPPPRARSGPGDSQPASAASSAPSSARKLDLPTALQFAFQNSREFKTASETLYRAGLGYSLTRYTFGPILDSTISYLWNYNEGAPNTHSIGVPLSVRQVLPLGGSLGGTASANGVRTRAGEVAGDNDYRWGSDLRVNLEQPLLRGAGYEVSHEGLTQAERSLIYAVRQFELFRQDFAIRVAQSYYDLVSQGKRLSNDEQNYKDALADRNKSEALRKLERNKPDDVFQARRREIEAETALVAARTDYRLRQDDFKILLGLATAEAIELSAEEPAFESAPLDSDSAVAVALHNRLDLHTQRDQLEDARRALRIAKNDLLPDLNLSASYGMSSAGLATTDATPNNRSGSVGMTLRLPLDKKAERNAYRSSQISLDQATRDLAQTENEIERDVRNAIRELAQFEKQITLQQDKLTSERRAVAIMAYRVESGEAQQRDLTDARQSLNNALNDLIELNVRHFVARLRLRRNLGVLFIDRNGMWEP
ncbi:MAG: TolC family protein [Planctomycetes bacterium]|nr:TolC family protein [Planctomycetota bacterium]